MTSKEKTVFCSGLIVFSIIFFGLIQLWDHPRLTWLELVSCGDVELLNAAILDGRLLDEQDEMGYAPVHYAVELKQLDSLKMLVVSGANLNVRTKKGDTILHLAVAHATDVFVEFLLDAGAPVNEVNDEGRSPLCLAVSLDSPSVSLLLSRGAVDAPGYCKGGGEIYCAARSGCLALLKEHQRRGGDFNPLSTQGLSALHYAVYERHSEVVHQLIDFGIDLDVCDRHGATPLHQAVRSGVISIMHMLVESGADLNRKDSHGDTPLLLAAKLGATEIFEALVRMGADVGVKNLNGDSVFDFPVSKNNAKIRFLLSEWKRSQEGVLAGGKKTP